jgi:hypothetical protein
VRPIGGSGADDGASPDHRTGRQAGGCITGGFASRVAGGFA